MIQHTHSFRIDKLHLSDGIPDRIISSMTLFTERPLKVLYGYPYYPSDAYGDTQKISLDYVERLKQAGFDVEGFCLTVNPPNHALTFRNLHKRWMLRDRSLLEMYERLERSLDGKMFFSMPPDLIFIHILFKNCQC